METHTKNTSLLYTYHVYTRYIVNYSIDRSKNETIVIMRNTNRYIMFHLMFILIIVFLLTGTYTRLYNIHSYMHIRISSRTYWNGAKQKDGGKQVTYTRTTMITGWGELTRTRTQWPRRSPSVVRSALCSRQAYLYSAVVLYVSCTCISAVCVYRIEKNKKISKHKNFNTKL